MINQILREELIITNIRKDLISIKINKFVFNRRMKLFMMTAFEIFIYLYI
jgi:hypothetical protein